MGQNSLPRARRSAGLLALAILTVPLLAGCLGGLPPEADAPTQPSVTDDGDSFQTSSTIEVTLDDLGPDVEWILFEVALTTNTTLSGHLSADLMLSDGAGIEGVTRKSQDACFGLHVGERGIFYFARHGGWGISARAAGLDTGVEADYLLGHRFIGEIELQPSDEPAGTVLPVLVAFDRPDDFAGTDGSLEVAVEADPAVRWRVAATGTVDCGTRLKHFDGDAYVSSNPLVHAEDLVATFDIEQAGHGWFSATSNGGYDVEVAGPNGTTWHEQGQALLTGPESVSTPLKALSPGQWELRVNELWGTGITGAMYAVLDLPAWAAAGLWPDEAE